MLATEHGNNTKLKKKKEANASGQFTVAASRATEYLA